jgi:hypothetical protein
MKVTFEQLNNWLNVNSLLLDFEKKKMGGFTHFKNKECP